MAAANEHDHELYAFSADFLLLQAQSHANLLPGAFSWGYGALITERPTQFFKLKWQEMKILLMTA